LICLHIIPGLNQRRRLERVPSLFLIVVFHEKRRFSTTISRRKGPKQFFLETLAVACCSGAAKPDRTSDSCWLDNWLERTPQAANRSTFSRDAASNTFRQNPRGAIWGEHFAENFNSLFLGFCGGRLNTCRFCTGMISFHRSFTENDDWGGIWKDCGGGPPTHPPPTAVCFGVLDPERARRGQGRRFFKAIRGKWKSRMARSGFWIRN